MRSYSFSGMGLSLKLVSRRGTLRELSYSSIAVTVISTLHSDHAWPKSIPACHLAVFCSVNGTFSLDSASPVREEAVIVALTAFTLFGSVAITCKSQASLPVLDGDHVPLFIAGA